MRGLYEILTEKKWMISPDFVHGIRKSLEQNLNTHAAFVRPKKTCGFVTAEDSDGEIYYPEEYQISEDGKQVRANYELNYENKQNFPFVSVLTVDGPITRNGGGCSYGSIDHRDMMMRAADHPLCCGHVFIINTPGGSAWAKNDYQQAIEYAHSRNQPVIAFVDGMCASAGMYLASLCDERYFMHPEDPIGCIGVMAAFYTEANGSSNKFTNETYHEIYDPESFDKNREYRDIANDGDTEKAIKELAELGIAFRADVKRACPNATEKHLHGKMFPAKEVIGILMDGQSTFLETVQRAFALYNGTAQAIKREESDEENSAEAKTEIIQDASSMENTQTPINMENYPLINAACGLKAGELAVKEEGVFMNAPLLDVMEAYLKDLTEKAAEAQTKIGELMKVQGENKSQNDENEKKLAEAVKAREIAEKALAEANQAHAKALEELSEKHNEILSEKSEEIKTVGERLAQTEKELGEVKEALTTAEQLVADQSEEISSLTNEPGVELPAGEAPANNGEGVKLKTLREFNPSLYKTNAERRAAFEKFKRGE